jgi:hypothetical protein
MRVYGLASAPNHNCMGKPQAQSRFHGFWVGLAALCSTGCRPKLAVAQHPLKVICNPGFKARQSNLNPLCAVHGWKAVLPISANQSTTKTKETIRMAKKSRGGRMTAAKNRAAASKGGRGPVKKRAAGKKIMST